MADTLKKELLTLEEQFWDAMKEGDVDAALQLTSDPCIVTGPQGVSSVDKATFAKMMQDAPWTLDDYEIRDAQVQQVSDDVAVIAYKVREDITVDGEELELEAADASTWMRKNGAWVCVMHTESLLGDPYGRDRNGGAS
jgi:ketosteroid isomerase-like protein